MNILMITINDPAGTAIAFTNAINRYTECTCRLITQELRYNFMFDKDLHTPWLDSDGWDEVEHLLQESDIFHFHMTADEHLELGPFKVRDYIAGKQIVHHHHGHPDFRGYADKYRTKYRSLKRHHLIVSTPDLLKLLPEAQWIPNLVPLDDPLYLPRNTPDNGFITVGQSPTRQDLKNTSDLRQVVEKLQPGPGGTAVELKIITNTDHKECLRRKRSCHIIFDHMQGYFGVSSLESLSQGKPVVAGLDDWNCQYIKEFTGAEKIPWVIACDKTELESKLETLIAEPQLRQAVGAQSRQFMETCWTEARVLESLLEFYKRTL